MADAVKQNCKGQVLVELLVIALILAIFLQFFFIGNRLGISDKALLELDNARFPRLRSQR